MARAASAGDVNDVALPRVRRGREHLGDYERSEIIYLVIRDRLRGSESYCFSNRRVGVDSTY